MYEKLIVFIQPRIIAQLFTFLLFYLFTFRLLFYLLPLSQPRTIAQLFTFLPFYFFTFTIAFLLFYL